MPTIPPAPVSEVLGSALSDDGQSICIGFRQPNGFEFSIAVTADDLDEIIDRLLHAKGQLPAPSHIGTTAERAISVSNIDFGRTPGTGEHFLRIRFTKGGHLGLSLSPMLAAGTAEQLLLSLGAATIAPGVTMN